MRYLSAALLLFASSLGSASEIAVKHRPPRLASAFPQGAERDKTLVVEARGENLDRAQAVVFSKPGIEGRVIESGQTRLRLEFTVAPAAAWGPHYFRVVGPRGASNPGLFRVGDQRHDIETEPNGRLDTCHGISIPVTVNGRLDHERDIDIFRFTASAGQNWIFDVRSARNGSGLDPSMILLDEDGRKLRHSEDHFIWDPFFSHEFETDGVYYVVLQPTRGRARPTHGYQLDIRQGPFLSSVAPVALAAGDETLVAVRGTGLATAPAGIEFSDESFSGRVEEAGRDWARLRISIPESARPGVHSFALSTRHGRSNPARFWVHALPPRNEGAALPIPSGFNGTAPYRSPDRFAFDASGGDTLVFAIKAHQLGVPVDMTLEILRVAKEGYETGDGERIARNDDAKLPGVRFNKDPMIVHTFENSGRFELLVRALTDVGGKNFPYFLEARRPRPSMELLLDTDRQHVYAGEEANITVTAYRVEGFKGSATLSIGSLPEGFDADPVPIPSVEPGKEADGSQGDRIEIAVRATGLPLGTFAEVSVTSSPDGVAAWNNVRIASGGGEGSTQARIDKATVVVAERPAFSLEAQRNTVNLVRGGSADIPVDVERREDFTSELSFRAENLPPGVLLKPSKADSAASRITLSLEARTAARAGSYADVTFLGADSEGRTEQAPPITVIVD